MNNSVVMSSTKICMINIVEYFYNCLKKSMYAFERANKYLSKPRAHQQMEEKAQRRKA